MKEKLSHKMLLIGLLLNVGMAMRPAAAPAPLPDNINDLRQMFAPGGTGTKNDFEQLPLAMQNKLVAELLNANNNDVQNTFFHAARNNLTWAIQPLLNRDSYYQAQINYNIALMSAAEHGNNPMVEALTSAKITSYSFFGLFKEDMDQCCLINRITHNKSVLMLAAQNGHAETVALLLNRKASVNGIYEDDPARGRIYRGHIALMLAAQNGHTAAVKVLIDAKANLDSWNKEATALMYAAANGQTETVKVLIDAKANLDIEDNEAMTALKYAATNGQTETVKTLIGAKAQIDTSRPVSQLKKFFDKANKPTALALAAQQGHVNTAQTIVDGYRNEVARSSYAIVLALENEMKKIHNNFRAPTQTVRTIVNGGNNNRSDFEQLPDTFLQTMTEYLPLADLAKLRRLSKACRIITQVQFEAQLRPHIICKFQDQQDEKCRAFIEKETREANLLNPLTIAPFDYWQAALAAAREADIADPAAQTGCAIA